MLPTSPSGLAPLRGRIVSTGLLRPASTLVLVLLGLSGCAHGTALRREYAEVHMAMPVRMVVYAPGDSLARAAARAAFGRIAALELILSDYRPQSELRAVERAAGNWVVVSADLFRVLEQAVHVARETGGAFDPTVGPVVALWREARRLGRMPDAARLDSARALVGWRRVALDTARQAVRLDDPRLRLDLGGIAKGYILEEALKVLRAHGIRSALVEAGGDVVASDAPPGRQGWHVDAPGAGPAFAARARALANEAIATSGPTEQFVILDGVRHSHVVDPRTGLGLTNQVTARVIARDAAVADALATALTVLPPEQRSAVLARFPGVVADVR